MIAAWCFQCGLDYAEDVAECVECGVPTVDYPASSLHRIEPDAEKIAYELHAWNGEARLAVEERLHKAHLAHEWQGPTLLISVDDEDAVDEVIEVVDDEMATGIGEGTATEDGRIGFDLGARNADLQRIVQERLDELGIEHELTGHGFLLVPSLAEDRVGDVVEAVQEELKATSTFGPGVAGVAAHDVVGSIFVAADVLRRTPRDGRHQRQLLDGSALAHELQLPFGYEAPMWRSVLDQCAVIVALIEDAGDDELIEAEARQLRDMLHPYV